MHAKVIFALKGFYRVGVGLPIYFQEETIKRSSQYATFLGLIFGKKSNEVNSKAISVLQLATTAMNRQ